jgi:hypothetical protein
MDRWARAFKPLKFPEIGDMKPSEMMWQMKALLPPDLTTGTYFMAAFLLCLPADMIDHIISQDFILYISIRPPASQRPAAKPTQPLSLPPQSLGGTCGGVPSVHTVSHRHMTYYTSHMLYICRYSP